MAEKPSVSVSKAWQRAQFKFWRLAEGRAVFEWQSFYLLRPLLKQLPRGDGHPVIVFPGFIASDVSTAPMRQLLSDLGYDVCGWGEGRNLTVDHALEQRLINLVKRVHQNTGRKVSLVGWSLGGIYARELAKALPKQVRCVVTLGSPISGRAADTNAANLFATLNGSKSRSARGDTKSYNHAPPVPTTSIYSRTDGIVQWRGSVQRDHAYPVNQQSENIELPASHLGLGVNAFAMIALLDRLHQAEGHWQPFKISGWRALWYRRPQLHWPQRLKSLLGDAS